MGKLSTASNTTLSQNSLRMKDVMARAAKCGVGSRYGFQLQEGDTILFPEAEEAFFRFESYKVTLKNGTREDRDIFLVGCEVNGKAKWVPMWALRKGPNSHSELDSELNNELYRSFVEDSMNDWERFIELSGKTFKVEVSEVETSKKDKRYTVKVYLLTSIEEKPQAPKRGRKSSK